MLSQIRFVKEKLDLAIAQLCETSWMFAKDPDRDFTRERKLPLREVISILLCMEGGSLTGELLRYFRCSRYSPSSSAFIQQRQKINEFAFPSLFSLFVKHTDKDSLYKGYRLLAADGSTTNHGIMSISITNCEKIFNFESKGGNPKERNILYVRIALKKHEFL